MLEKETVLTDEIKNAPLRRIKRSDFIKLLLYGVNGDTKAIRVLT